jgi:hypothetical protein
MLEILNATHAEWKWHRNQDRAAEVGDATTIVRNTACGGPGSDAAARGAGRAAAAAAGGARDPALATLGAAYTAAADVAAAGR